MNENIDFLIETLEKSGKNYNIEKIKKAYEYAAVLHDGQFRKSGEKYICHPIAVAEIVADFGLDTDSICAAFLHDTIEDCADKTNMDDIKKMFGGQVAELVDGLTKLVQLQFADKEDVHMESLRKMFLAMAKDVRVIFIKLADRIHNMRTLDAQPEEKRRRIALETMHVYAPLAHRLGMQRVKQELENSALSYLDPNGYNAVRGDIDRKFGQNQNFIDNIKTQILNQMEQNGIKCTLEGRVKSVYSIYRKMYKQDKSFDEIYDFYAVRIIVNTELECYTALGIIHEMYNTIPGRFKDYISIPKPNMYRSLHTTVIGRDGIPFEVQIRTWEMHQIAEFGIAAHWKYKSGDKGGIELDKKLEWISKLVENESSTLDPDDFIDALKIDIFSDETFVFTPRGDVITLPQDSNCIDFAYHIHSEVGNKMVGAKVNGMIVPIDRTLHNGEIVEVITSSSTKGPSRDWLKIAKTSDAKAKIRQWFKKEKREDNIIAGKEEIEAEIKRYGKCTPEQFELIVANTASRSGMGSPDDLYNMIGYGGISVSKIAIRLRDEYDKIANTEEEPPITGVSQIPITENKKNNGTGVIVDGEEGCVVKFAKCCNPLPGDNIVGFITKGFGISVHKFDCPNVISIMDKEKDRFVNVEWRRGEVESKVDKYEGLLQIYAEDRISMFADISSALAEMRVSISSVYTQKKSDDTSLIFISVSCKNVSHLHSIIAKLKSIKGVYEITRGYTK
ncbi:MAG: bifunctional (p)ppGpp synthetase/guanosine-3',5'-bis(diphosphate) 3'-pyrophosphohydrolase [Clostridiales bacterium]|nr:bifunctional (p)ppGpp synthetase/guanosine-3',5'-bis(diphosphate) 3'-pyrophosphohydrolase [Clostridiales bacterium]